jgi:serine/threonine protein kinase
MTQIASALRHLHESEGIAHGHVHADNVRFSSEASLEDEDPRARLCDHYYNFVSRRVQGADAVLSGRSFRNLSAGGAGEAFAPPEDERGFASDVFSLGVLAHSLTTLALPGKDGSHATQSRRGDGGCEDPGLARVAEACTAALPRRRPTADDVVRWLQDPEAMANDRWCPSSLQRVPVNEGVYTDEGFVSAASASRKEPVLLAPLPEMSETDLAERDDALNERRASDVHWQPTMML